MATISKYQTASGATLCRVRYRTPENRQTDKRGFTTKRDAEQFANKVEVAKMTGEYIGASVGKVTVGALGPAWLQRQQGHMKPSGFRSYDSAWRVHVEPRWGAVRIADIRYSEVQAWVSELSGKPGASVVHTAYSVLARILDDAVRDRLLASNPARWGEAAQTAPSAQRLPDGRAAGSTSRRVEALPLACAAAGSRWPSLG